jgi:hypothetical protein
MAAALSRILSFGPGVESFTEILAGEVQIGPEPAFHQGPKRGGCGTGAEQPRRALAITQNCSERRERLESDPELENVPVVESESSASK